MIKCISFDLQGTLSCSEFSDFFWIKVLPEKYAQKNNISIDEAKQIMKNKFKSFGVYNRYYYDDKYWSELLNFSPIEELNKNNIKPKLNEEFINYIKKIDLNKIIISTTTNLFINYELGNQIKYFNKIYSCIDYFNIAGKTSEVYLKVADEMKIRPQNILHIGDNYTMDVVNANKAGVNAILFKGNINETIQEIENCIKNNK